MNNKIITIWILMTIILTGLANAQMSDLGEFKQGSCVPLAQSYYNSTWTNITKIQVGNTVTNVNYAMTRDAYGNYNYSYCNTNTLGQYIYTTCTDTDGVLTCVPITFTITSRGDNSQDQNFTQSAFFIGLALLVGIFMYLKMSRFFGSMIIMITGFGTMFAVTNNGWIGWIIASSGFIMIIYSILTPKGRSRGFRRRY